MKTVTSVMPKKYQQGILLLVSALLAACGGGSDSKPTNQQSNSTNYSAHQNNTNSTTNSHSNNNTHTNSNSTNHNTKVSNLQLSQNNYEQIELAVFNDLNIRRTSCGFTALQPNQQLKNAAINHANYVAYMNQYSTAELQGHHEVKVDEYSGESNPYYSGRLSGNRINNTNTNRGRKTLPTSYSYQSSTENLSIYHILDRQMAQTNDMQMANHMLQGLLAAPYHMSELLNPYFTEIGVAYRRTAAKQGLSYQGRYYPVQGMVLETVSARPYNLKNTEKNQILNYPCEGIKDTDYKLTNETPNPLPNRNLKTNPIGQPIYIVSQTGSHLTVTDYKMTDENGQAIALQALTHDNDPNRNSLNQPIINPNETILMPLKALQPNTSYHISYKAKVDHSSVVSRQFTFKTRDKSKYENS